MADYTSEGRFIQRDPVWDAANVGGQYSFAGSGPLSSADPMGHTGEAEQAARREYAADPSPTNQNRLNRELEKRRGMPLGSSAESRFYREEAERLARNAADAAVEAKRKLSATGPEAKLLKEVANKALGHAAERLMNSGEVAREAFITQWGKATTAKMPKVITEALSSPLPAIKKIGGGKGKALGLLLAAGLIGAGQAAAADGDGDSYYEQGIEALCPTAMRAASTGEGNMVQAGAWDVIKFLETGPVTPLVETAADYHTGSITPDEAKGRSVHQLIDLADSATPAGLGKWLSGASDLSDSSRQILRSEYRAAKDRLDAGLNFLLR